MLALSGLGGIAVGFLLPIPGRHSCYTDFSDNYRSVASADHQRNPVFLGRVKHDFHRVGRFLTCRVTEDLANGTSGVTKSAGS